MPVKSIEEVKTGLRGRYHRFREGLSEKERLRLDPGIQSRLLSLREYNQADTVFTYIGRELEINTLTIVQAAQVNQKRVAVPRYIPGTRDMGFYYIRPWQDLEYTSFGVMEPIVQRCGRVEDESRGFCLVSGSSFDVQGFRPGYDGGYYDCFLSRLGRSTVGVYYSFCIQWDLPHGYYDRSVGLLATEKYVRRISKKAKQEVCHARRRQLTARPRPGGSTAEPGSAFQGQD